MNDQHPPRVNCASFAQLATFLYTPRHAGRGQNTVIRVCPSDRLWSEQIETRLIGHICALFFLLKLFLKRHCNLEI